MINTEDTNPRITTKARYWVSVGYPENMIDKWQDNIGDLLELPFAYCIHDKDKLSDHAEDRKVHVHIIIVFPNTTTYKHALSVFRLLGFNAFNTCEPVINIRSKYEYLIHNTETCIKKGKFLYDLNERVTGNNFDIGSYEQISLAERKQFRNELSKYVLDEFITNYSDLYLYVLSNFPSDYEDILCTYSGHFERLCKGNWLKLTKQA